MNDGVKVFLTILGVIAVFVIIFAAWPQYRVWQRELSGKAQLKEAEWNRQIAIEEAQAIKLSATLLADAEVERAKGVAAANEIIGESLEGHCEYLQYLAILGLQDSDAKLIYIPHSGGLPLLEATRGLEVPTKPGR
jgi:hypothetical protein